MKHSQIVRLAGALLLAVGLLGCDPPIDPLAEPPADDKKSLVKPPHEQVDHVDPKISQALMISLSLAKNYHHRADVFLKDGNFEQAIASVQTILRIKFPNDTTEEQDTKFDARARLGKLYIGIGKLDEARKVVDEGLAQQTRRSFFLANLHTVSGEVYTAQTLTLDKTDPAQAKELRRKALQAFDASIDIALEVQGTILKESGQ